MFVLHYYIEVSNIGICTCCEIESKEKRGKCS